MMPARIDGSLRVALYARVSTADKAQDPENQLRALRAHASARGWSLFGEFVDEGISGARRHRPQLDAMLAAVRRREVDIVAVWRFDRFARTVAHLVEALGEFNALGVAFVSLHEQIDTTTPVGKAMFTMVAALAELERDLHRERIRAGMERAKAAGRSLGRRPRVVDVRAARDLLTAGHSEVEVAKMLNLSRGTLRRRLRECRAPDQKGGGPRDGPGPGQNN